VFRGRFRKSFEKPESLTPNKVEEFSVDLHQQSYRFKKGHRLMVQVQSSWFPLVDRNPQKFMEIPKAARADFQKATHRVHRARGLDSSVTLMIEGAAARLPEQKVGSRQ
jgi:predicted acyl esterase